MPLPHQANWPPTNDEDEFDRMVRDVLAVRYQKPNLARLGRRGQNQDGIDGFDPANGSSPVYQATIQKDKHYKKLVSDLAQMDANWHLQPQEFVYALGVPRDANLQRKVLALNMERQQAKKCLVTLLFWEDICEVISAQPDLRSKYYPWVPNPVIANATAKAATSVVIDAEHLIVKMLEAGISPEHISRQLSGAEILRFINDELGRAASPIPLCSSIDLLFPEGLISSGSIGFSAEQQSEMYARIGRGESVFTEAVSSAAERRAEFSTRIQEARQTGEPIIILSLDDQIVREVAAARRDMKAIALIFAQDPPSNLEGKFHASIAFERDFVSCFTYAYPHFAMRGFGPQQCAMLLSEADDRLHNTLTVTRSGYIRIIREIDLGEVRSYQFRFEGFCAGNGYVGPLAASDVSYIDEQTKDILTAWRRGLTGYIDYPPDL